VMLVMVLLVLPFDVPRIIEVISYKEKMPGTISQALISYQRLYELAQPLFYIPLWFSLKTKF
jgi:hypothetical protein